LVGVVVLVAAFVTLVAQAPSPAGTCEPIGRPQFLPAVSEASGIALAGGALWTHNDSDAPVLFRIDASGRAAPVTVVGAEVRDWEDIASASCAAFAGAAAEPCFYIGDIGDNRGSRQRITIYEVPMPAPAATSTKPAVAIHVRYPDHPHDAEALLILPGSAQLKLSPTVRQLSATVRHAYIITKEIPARVYRFQISTNPGETGTLTLFRTLNEKVRITGAAVSSDERWVALRSNNMLLVYTLDDFAKGGSPVRVDLTNLKEPQGEGVAFGRGGELYLVSESGGGGAAGVLTRVRCAFIR
jgi:hypothetical protein